MSFASDLNQFIKTAKVKGTLTLRTVGFDALAGVLLRSPVDTGRFRGSWRVGINATDLSSLGPQKRGGNALRASEGEQKKISTAVLGDTVFISNNVPYAKKLEEGSSRQAPQGILGTTVQELALKLNQIVESV